MDVIRIAAFSDEGKGGNPAGVVIERALPEAAQMQKIAAEVGYSETAFAAPMKNGDWRVRYFSPESEIPFCGHATIALGAALAMQEGDGVFDLVLNEARISVEGRHEGGAIVGALQSPPTHSGDADDELVSQALALFGYDPEDLDLSIPPARINGGAPHLLLALKARQRLADMSYDMEAGRAFMTQNDLATVSLVYAQMPRLFHARNPFASGGVYEDPATGAAAAALAGYLRDINWPHEGDISIIQGEDMGARSSLRAEFSDIPASSIRVSGGTRQISSPTKY